MPPDEPTRAHSPGTSEVIPRKGRLLGLDYGTKRFGVAVTNPDQTIASPVSNWDRKDLLQDERFLKQQAQSYSAVGIIVGLPVHLSGDESEKSRESRRFGDWAGKVCKLPVAYYDERFSTAFAEQELLAAGLTSKQRKARRDMLAAQYLLQSFIESRQPESSNGEDPSQVDNSRNDSPGPLRDV